MLKRYIWLALATVFFAFQLFIGTASAAELDKATRTLSLNNQGDTFVLSLQQIKKGKRLFSDACAQCHLGGGTKTDPNIDLSEEALSLATPPRNNVESMVDYMKNPTTYDGQQSIAETHPSLKSSDIFPEMRNLADDDLKALAGYILLQPKVAGDRWAGGKIYY